MTQDQFNALTAFIDAAVKLAASCETCYGGEPWARVAYEKALKAAEVALVETTPLSALTRPAMDNAGRDLT